MRRARGHRPSTSTASRRALAEGQRPAARLPRRLRRAAALGALPRPAGRTPHGDRALAARLPRRRARPHACSTRHLDWLLAVRQIIQAAGLRRRRPRGHRPVGASLAAEMAALWPDSVRRLALIAPFGLFDEADPPTDPWAQRADQVAGLMCADPEIWKALKAVPEGANTRRMADRADPRRRGRGPHLLAARQHPAGEAPAADQGADPAAVGRAGPRHAAQLRRAHRRRLGGPNEIRTIPGAGHLAELDRPDMVADAILSWMG